MFQIDRDAHVIYGFWGTCSQLGQGSRKSTKIKAWILLRRRSSNTSDRHRHQPAACGSARPPHRFLRGSRAAAKEAGEGMDSWRGVVGGRWEGGEDANYLRRLRERSGCPVLCRRRGCPVPALRWKGPSLVPFLWLILLWDFPLSWCLSDGVADPGFSKIGLVEILVAL